MKICVGGIGAVSAIGFGAEENRASLAAGHDGLGPVTLFETVHHIPVGEVKADNARLAARLSLPPGRTFSRTSLLGMTAAAEALADAGLGEAGQRYGLRLGLISATSVGGMDLTGEFYRDFMRDPSSGRLRMAASHDCYTSTRDIAAHCGITGFATTVSTACSSAANAIMLAARMIRAGLLDAAVAGGTDALCRFTLNGFGSLMILDGAKCRPFDASRAGLNLGEGAGYVVLQREDTLRRSPYCELAGWANANDAFHQTASSAEGEGACLSMTGALRSAGMSPGEVDYINVHGTGTPNNDASESAAMRRIWGADVPPFSSTKPFTGHTLAAAGGLEAVFSVLAIAHGALWPNLNFEAPIDGPGLTPQTSYVDGIEIGSVMSNSFGFGGNNSTLIFRK